MDDALQADILAFAQTIALRLASIDGVIAVSLGGSWARGTADATSDIDLGIYYHGDQRPSLVELSAAAVELDDRHGSEGDVITPFGEWGEWINGGGWLTIQGRHIDWLYRDLTRVRHFIEECAAGRPKTHYQAGHPFGFSTAIYMGEVFYTLPLVDPHGILSTLKTFTDPYPSPLKKALIHQLWEANFALGIAEKPAARGDVYYVTGSMFRAASVMTQALFALNERYWINEKSAVAMLESFPITLADYARRLSALLGSIGETPEQMKESLHGLRDLAAEVQQLCAQSGEVPPA